MADASAAASPATAVAAQLGAVRLGQEANTSSTPMNVDAPAPTPAPTPASAPHPRPQPINVDGQAETRPRGDSEFPQGNVPEICTEEEYLKWGEQLEEVWNEWQKRHGSLWEWYPCEEMPIPREEEYIPPPTRNFTDQGSQMETGDKWDNLLVQDKQCQVGDPDPAFFRTRCFQDPVARLARWPMNFFPTPRGDMKTFKMQCPECKGTWFHTNCQGIKRYEKLSLGRELKMYTNKESCWYCAGTRSFDIPCKGRSERHGIRMDYKGHCWLYTETQPDMEAREPKLWWARIFGDPKAQSEWGNLFWSLMNEGLKQEDKYDHLDRPQCMDDPQYNGIWGHWHPRERQSHLARGRAAPRPGQYPPVNVPPEEEELPPLEPAGYYE